MAVFLDLGRQGGPPRHVALGMEDLHDLLQHRLGQAIPLNGRVALGVVGVEQLPVLDEEQGVGHHVGDVREGRVAVARVVLVVVALVAAVEEGQARHRLFRVGQEQAVVHQLGHLRRDPGLAGDGEALFLQALAESGQADVAQPDVVGAGFGEADAVAGSSLGLVGEALAVARQEHGLEGRGDQFVGSDGRSNEQDQEQSDTEPDPAHPAFHHIGAVHLHDERCLGQDGEGTGQPASPSQSRGRRKSL